MRKFIFNVAPNGTILTELLIRNATDFMDEKFHILNKYLSQFDVKDISEGYYRRDRDVIQWELPIELSDYIQSNHFQCKIKRFLDETNVIFEYFNGFKE